MKVKYWSCTGEERGAVIHIVYGLELCYYFNEEERSVSIAFAEVDRLVRVRVVDVT